MRQLPRVNSLYGAPMGRHDQIPAKFDPAPRELDKARKVAVWPDATDVELMQEPEALKAALEARLPALLEAFKADMLTCGFVWPERNRHA